MHMCFSSYLSRILSMCKLLEHTINNGDKRLSDIIVKGERRVDHETGILYYPSPLSRFSTWRICSREQRKKQLDWLVTNTDDITSQSHSFCLFARTSSPSGKPA